jgi:hypothetical protein
MRRTLLAISAAAALLAGACGSSRPHAAPSSTVATVPLPTTLPLTTTSPVETTVPPAPTTVAPTTVAPTTVAPTTTLPVTATVPAQITVAYVDAVLAKLNHVYGDAVRASVKLGAEEQKIFLEDIREGLGGIRPHPGDRVSRVTKLVSASPACIYARITTIYDAVDKRHPPTPADEYVELSRKAEPQAALALNPTAWIYTLDLTYGNPTVIANQCHDG